MIPQAKAYWSHLPLCAMMTLLTTLTSALPEQPAIIRDVHCKDNEFSGMQHTRPHIANFRTTADGRIAVPVRKRNENGLSGPGFFLINPEDLSNHFTEGNVGTQDIFSTTTPVVVDEGEFHDLIPNSNSIRQLTIIDHTTEFDVGNESQNNPRAEWDSVSGTYKDVYYIWVFATVQDKDVQVDSYFQKTPVKITVANPKTASATIESVVIDTNRSKERTTNSMPVGDILEPMFTLDGKLLVCRINTRDYNWIHPNDGTPQTTPNVDSVYAYSADGSLTGLENLIPLTVAPFDNRINTTYGFAMHPFRDAEGTPMPFGFDIQGSYPWIDAEGNNLFFTTVGSRLVSSVDLVDRDRYPLETYLSAPDGERVRCQNSLTRGQSVIGLWTQGKLVQMDNLLNNTDYGIESDASKSYNVTLYDASGPLTDGKVRVGSGRDNGGGAPPASSSNTAIFDSTENKLFYSEYFKPRLPQDVVWFVSNGKATDEFPFDDYLNLDSFIVSHMTGALSFDTSIPTGNGKRRSQYHDGWNTSNWTFDQPVKLANDGTALPARWKVPPHGATHGTVRLEPIAMGGINGKGFWLDGSSGVTYNIDENQPTDVTTVDWYFGIFLDCRFSDDNTSRTIIRFPDGSEMQLKGRDIVHYLDSSGTIKHTISLQSGLILPEGGWAHIAVQVFENGTFIDFYHNGFLFNNYSSTTDPLFRMTDGQSGDDTLHVGKVQGASTAGFMGWIDEFKVFAQTFDPEVCANHARGTLVGFADGAHSTLQTKANLYGTIGKLDIDYMLSHFGQTTYQNYAVWSDYTDDMAAHLQNIPGTVTSVRGNLLSPEGPVFRGTHRPDTSSNAFCLSCHGPSSLSKGGLTIGALTLDSIINAEDDHRRQPSQPFRRVFGSIPANWLGTSLPAEQTNSSGAKIDKWDLPLVDPATREAVTLSMVDVQNGKPLDGLDVLDSYIILDPGNIGVDLSEFNLRANLDAAQGGVRYRITNTSVTPDVIVVNDEVVDELPYKLDISTLTDGVYTIKATPVEGATDGIPLELTGVEFANFTLPYLQHLDANAGVNGSPVTDWYDLSTNDLHAGNAFGTIQYDSSTGMVDMGAARSYLELMSAAESDQFLDQSSGSSNGFCVMIAFKVRAMVGSSWNDLIGNSTAVSSGFGMRYNASGTMQAWINGKTLNRSSSPAQVGDTIVFALNYDPTTDSYDFWDSKNNSSSTRSSVPEADFSLSNGIRIGATTNSSRYIDGFIGEVKIIDRTLTTQEFQDELDTLVAKWVVIQ
ncbi:MAG: hypothetical protein AAF065_05435 [Verrucomicrobiota bacterium]